MLDVLRAVACLLVIGFHARLPQELDPILFAWNRVGWVGVDLFFVLSGFLVSGLLFQEFRRRGSVDVVRFLTRRGLKIYPAFYFFLALTIGYFFVFGPVPRVRQIVAELLFVQNFWRGVWLHTWSLAVEEHFYIGIAVLVVLVLKCGGKRGMASIPWLMGAIMITCLGLRLAAVYYGAGRRLLFGYTHYRIDALGCGVLLSYFWHFFRETTLAFVRRAKYVFLIGGCLLLVSVPYLWFDRPQMLCTIGLTVTYLGGGMLLLSLTAIPLPANRLVSLVAYVGASSYSIYLWHSPVIRWLVPRMRSHIGFSGGWVTLLITIASCVILGVLMARCVEYPILRLRDHFFPTKSI